MNPNSLLLSIVGEIAPVADMTPPRRQALNNKVWGLSLKLEIDRQCQEWREPRSQRTSLYDPAAGIEVVPPRAEDHNGAADIYYAGMERRHFRMSTVQHRRWKREPEA